ncbi:MAG: hypothetical protein IT463_03425 [Planctomycetes bacterium]|nr:hypothetical protein [Planctomycetota bacterium]
MKKIYFLTKPQPAATYSGKWRNRLKNTYKGSDAVRDIIEWTQEGREFYVALVNHSNGDRRVFHMNPPGSPEICTDFATHRPVLNVIDQILRLCADNADIDIQLLERRRGGNPNSGRFDGPHSAA